MHARILDFGARGSPEEESRELERDVWTLLAEATENALYIAQSAWWNRILSERKGANSADSRRVL